MKKNGLFKFFAALLCIMCCYTCFTSCENEEVNPENLKYPDENSLITYTISDTEQIVLLYDSDGKIWGEWRKGDTTKRIMAIENIEYWGFLFSREGIADCYFAIYEIEGLEIFGDTNINDEFIGSPRMDYLNPTYIASTNAGLLNSTSITVFDSDTVVPITNTSVAPSDFEKWEWYDLTEWTEFCSYEENTVFGIDELNITYTPYRNIGEWKQGEVTVPIKIYFYEDIQAIAVYDLSDNGSKLIFIANVFLNENGDMAFNTVYGNLYNDEIDIKSVVLRKERLTD